MQVYKKTSVPQTEHVKVASLKPAPWNPPNRIQKERLTPILRSMDSYGMVQPIIITSENVIVEGHRRWTCAKMLKWTHIAAIVMTEDQTANMMQIYSSVNSSLAKHSGNDQLGVWLLEPMAVKHQIAQKLSNVEAVIGRTLLQKIYKRGMSIRLFYLAKRIANECDCETPAQIERIIQWFMDHRNAGQVAKLLSAGHDPHTILKACLADKPLKMKLSVA